VEEKLLLATQTDPGDIPMGCMGKALARAKVPQKSRRKVRKALKLDGRDVNAWRAMGEAQESLRHYRRAVAA